MTEIPDTTALRRAVSHYTSDNNPLRFMAIALCDAVDAMRVEPVQDEVEAWWDEHPGIDIMEFYKVPLDALVTLVEARRARDARLAAKGQTRYCAECVDLDSRLRDEQAHADMLAAAMTAYADEVTVDCWADCHGEGRHPAHKDGCYGVDYHAVLAAHRARREAQR